MCVGGGFTSVGHRILTTSSGPFERNFTCKIPIHPNTFTGGDDFPGGGGGGQSLKTAPIGIIQRGNTRPAATEGSVFIRIPDNLSPLSPRRPGRCRSRCRAGAAGGSRREERGVPALAERERKKRGAAWAQHIGLIPRLIGIFVVEIQEVPISIDPLEAVWTNLKWPLGLFGHDTKGGGVCAQICGV